MTPSIETRRYYLSHLKQPRGRGFWLFEDESGTVVFSFNGPYAEARRAAIAHCKQHGIKILYVGP